MTDFVSYHCYDRPMRNVPLARRAHSSSFGEHSPLRPQSVSQATCNTVGIRNFEHGRSFALSGNGTATCERDLDGIPTFLGLWRHESSLVEEHHNSDYTRPLGFVGRPRSMITTLSPCRTPTGPQLLQGHPCRAQWRYIIEFKKTRCPVHIMNTC